MPKPGGAGAPAANAWLARIESTLEPLLGGFTTKMAVKTAALRSLKKPPEELVRADAPQLIEGLKPMLATLVGALHTKILLEQIDRELQKP